MDSLFLVYKPLQVCDCSGVHN